jgi:hypothetical protein
MVTVHIPFLYTTYISDALTIHMHGTACYPPFFQDDPSLQRFNLPLHFLQRKRCSLEFVCLFLYWVDVD